MWDRTQSTTRVVYLIVIAYTSLGKYYLPIVPPKKDIDRFRHKLMPDMKPILVTPYQMALAKLKELKAQLNNLVDKGFIQPSIYPWGTPMLFL